jgi:type I restriction enzyme R subunit
MATGAGKTRTTIALVDLLMRANLVKRVLFLADRTALVNQAVNAFKAHLPDSSPVNLVTERNEDGRVYASTYQTMIGLLDQLDSDGVSRFGVGHFDLVVIDEAHRSVYKKYRGIFEYFDSLLVGLTATPKDEVSTNTYELFDLESGVPTDAYSLEEAIADGYLVPPKTISVPLKFLREGIKYDELSAEEKQEWDETEWDDEDDEAPDEVGAPALNKWLFNTDTVDKVLEHLMTNGIHVAGGDRLGKTMIFAKSQKHAEFIYERFVANYPALDNGNFARIITSNVKYGQSLIDDFSQAEKSPHIAISVDMLDTGIDVPECVNLVFFKLIRSKTKFWQMLGRGTRLRPDLLGPGDDKTHFMVFDYCQNLEYFSEDISPPEVAATPSLTERLWRARVDILGELLNLSDLDDSRSDLVDRLQAEVASMNQNNFLVRPHLRLVERFAKPEAWASPTLSDLQELRQVLASLPREHEPEPEEAKRFDVIVLSAQQAHLEGGSFDKQQERIRTIAGLLELIPNIPAVAAEMELILAVQTDEWWQHVTHPMLESTRKRMRMLVGLIDRKSVSIVYTSFDDEIGEGEEIDVLPVADSFAQFRKKAAFFLKQNLAEAAVAKVRSGQPITAEDVAELQRILVAAGVGDDVSFEAASARAGSFGRFVRSLVGLDREAAKTAFNSFLDDKTYTSQQIRFVNLIIDELTSTGIVEPTRLYNSPYVGLAPEGPEALFNSDDLDGMFAAIETLTASAGG